MFCIIQFGNQVALFENIKLNYAVVLLWVFCVGALFREFYEFWNFLLSLSFFFFLFGNKGSATRKKGKQNVWHRIAEKRCHWLKFTNTHTHTHMHAWRHSAKSVWEQIQMYSYHFNVYNAIARVGRLIFAHCSLIVWCYLRAFCNSIERYWKYTIAMILLSKCSVRLSVSLCLSLSLLISISFFSVNTHTQFVWCNPKISQIMSREKERQKEAKKRDCVW